MLSSPIWWGSAKGKFCMIDLTSMVFHCMYPDVCYVWTSDIYVLHSLRNTPGTVMFALSSGPHSVPAVECTHFRQDWGRKHKASFTSLLSHVQTKEKRLQKGKSNKKYISIIQSYVAHVDYSSILEATLRRYFSIKHSLVVPSLFMP